MGHSVYIKVYFFVAKNLVENPPHTIDQKKINKNFEKFEAANKKWFSDYSVDLENFSLKTKKYNVVQSAHIFSEGSNVFAKLTKDLVTDEIIPICKKWADDVNQVGTTEQAGLIVFYGDEFDRSIYDTCVVKCLHIFYMQIKLYLFIL